jgi:hypothetical protein
MPTPPQAQPRVEPTAINGAVPRTVDPPRTPPAPAHVPSHAAPVVPAPRTPATAPPAPVAGPATSGPDTAQRRYADAELDNSWFATKPRPAPDSPAQDTTARDTTARETTAPDSATPGPAGAAQTAAPQRPSVPAPPATDGDPPTPATGQPAPDARPRQRAGTGHQPVDAAPPARDDQTPQAATAGMVLNLDITGLVNGLSTTTATPADAPETSGDSTDTGSGTASTTSTGTGTGTGTGKDWRITDAPADEEPAATRPIKPLSAADLEAIRWRLDGGTLREVVDDRDALRELGDRLDGPLSEDQDNATRAGLLSVRAEVYRLLGELGMAAAASRLALAHAESSGDVQAVVIAQAELAHVLRLRGDFVDADRLFEEAAGSEAPERVRSVVHENAGRCCFDQGRHMEALDHFARAVRLGAPDDTDLVERIGVSLEAVYIHVLRDGWGPYPRLRREILGPVRAAQPEAGPPR